MPGVRSGVLYCNGHCAVCNGRGRLPKLTALFLYSGILGFIPVPSSIVISGWSKGIKGSIFDLEIYGNIILIRAQYNQFSFAIYMDAHT